MLEFSGNFQKFLSQCECQFQEMSFSGICVAINLPLFVMFNGMKCAVMIYSTLF